MFFATIKYRVSGKVVYKGDGIENIKLDVYNVTNWEIEPDKDVITDKNGDFYFYISSGIYEIVIQSQKGFVSVKRKIIITVKNKNVKNVIFIMEKSCTISGFVGFEDGTPLKRTGIDISNKRGVWNSHVNSKTGKYSISGILGLDNTEISILPDGVLPPEPKKTISLTEGEQKEVNFIMPKRLSIKGKIIDKSTKEIIIVDSGISIGGPHYIFMTRQDESGYFYFYNLKPGKHIIGFIEVIGDDLKENVIEFYLKENETKEITLEMEKK